MSQANRQPCERGRWPDRWPDRFAAALYLFGAFTIVVAIVPTWRHYFSRSDDLLSVLTIPVVPSLVYAALLFVVGAALRRRLSAAWWLFVVWWLLLPALSLVLSLLDEFRVDVALGLVLVAAVTVVAVLAKPQFVARRVVGSLTAALLCSWVASPPCSSSAPGWSTGTATRPRPPTPPTGSWRACSATSAAST